MRLARILAHLIGDKAHSAIKLRALNEALESLVRVQDLFCVGALAIEFRAQLGTGNLPPGGIVDQGEQGLRHLRLCVHHPFLGTRRDALLACAGIELCPLVANRNLPPALHRHARKSSTPYC